MHEFLGKVVVSAIGVSVAAWLLDGIQLGTAEETWPSRLGTVLGVAAILAGLNAVLKPLLTFLSIPLLIVTLGLFSFVISAGILWLTSRLAGSLHLAFHVDNFWWQSVLGALVITVCGIVTEPIFVRDEKDSRS